MTAMGCPQRRAFPTSRPSRWPAPGCSLTDGRAVTRAAAAAMRASACCGCARSDGGQRAEGVSPLSSPARKAAAAARVPHRQITDGGGASAWRRLGPSLRLRDSKCSKAPFQVLHGPWLARRMMALLDSHLS